MRGLRAGRRSASTRSSPFGRPNRGTLTAKRASTRESGYKDGQRGRRAPSGERRAGGDRRALRRRSTRERGARPRPRRHRQSALLRQVADRGRRNGWSPVLVEGRELPPVADALEEALSPAEHERPLILIDTYERMTALGSHLRRALLRRSRSTRSLSWPAARRPSAAGSRRLREAITRARSSSARCRSPSRRAARRARAERRPPRRTRSPLGERLAARADALDRRRRGRRLGPRAGESGEMVRTLVRRLAEAEIEAATATCSASPASRA